MNKLRQTQALQRSMTRPGKGRSFLLMLSHEWTQRAKRNTSIPERQILWESVCLWYPEQQSLWRHKVQAWLLRDWQERVRELLFNGHRVSILQDVRVVEMEVEMVAQHFGLNATELCNSMVKVACFISYVFYHHKNTYISSQGHSTFVSYQSRKQGLWTCNIR